MSQVLWGQKLAFLSMNKMKHSSVHNWSPKNDLWESDFPCIQVNKCDSMLRSCVCPQKIDGIMCWQKILPQIVHLFEKNIGWWYHTIPWYKKSALDHATVPKNWAGIMLHKKYQQTTDHQTLKYGISLVSIYSSK